MRKYRAIVVHSGGMDSSICLKIAIDKFGHENVLSLGFNYNQRHDIELDCANNIANYFKVDRSVLDITCLQEITDNALINKNTIIKNENTSPNTLVVGRNGLMARLAAVHAENLGADSIYLGVIEVEEANSGYRDCSRSYMDKMEEILKIDLNNDQFKIETPLVKLNKFQTMELANKLGVLKFLLENTISCYEGIPEYGCGKCPACSLRNKGIADFLNSNVKFDFSYRKKFS